MSHRADDHGGSVDAWMKAFGPHASTAAEAILRLDKSFDRHDRPKEGVHHMIKVDHVARGLLGGHPQDRDEAISQLVKTGASHSGVVNLAGNELQKHGVPPVRSHFPVGKPVRSPDGAWEVMRMNAQPRRIEHLGPNASGAPMHAEVDDYRVRHVASGKSRTVPHASVIGFEDNSTPPGESLRKIHEMGRALGIQNPERLTLNCAAGIGRSATLMVMGMMAQEIDGRTARGEKMDFRQVADFMVRAVEQMRRQRGHAVMPDPYQELAALMFGLDYLNEKQAAGAARPAHGSSPAPTSVPAARRFAGLPGPYRPRVAAVGS